MYNINVQFTHPWLLLLIIPAVAFTLLPYFRLSKKYRRTRNRITSIALHLAIMMMITLLLSGFTVDYQIANDENELIFLVDVSNTEEQSALDRDQYLQNLLNEGSYDSFKMGVVTFGFDQVYASKLSYKDPDEIFDAYREAELPDISATNIAAALLYTRDLFKNPATGKIILLTDGKETDEEARGVIRSVTGIGLKLDVAYIPSSYDGTDVQVVGVEFPEYHLMPGDEFTLNAIVQSNDANGIYGIEISDNGRTMMESSTSFTANGSTQRVEFLHTFEDEGLHEITVTVSSLSGSGNMLIENDVYTTYYNLELFKKILIIERTADTSLEIIKMLNEGNIAPFEIQTMQIKSNDLPQTAEELCAWDQVILNNIAFADMPSGYDEELNEYVHTYGGGMLTVGGMKEDGETANAYNREDLYGTAYQSMLPVEAIEYTPPVGVIFLVDTSGSMGGSSDSEGETRLDYAKTGVFAAMKVLSPRDYMGIMTFDSVEDKVLDLTPVTREEEIIKALNTLTPNGGTTLAPALESAYISLNSLDKVAKRHIVVVTDAAISDKAEDYEGMIKANYPNVTLSVVCIDGNLSGENLEKMQNAVELGGGRLIQATREDVTVAMREELCAEAIKETVYETFNPIVYTRNSPLVKNMVYLPNSSSHLAVQLDGFHGTKVREGAELVLMGDYEVPIYAQWKYGKGTVGSFMCDLTGHWSSEFINSIVGRTFITNVVNNLMPTESLRPSDIKVVLTEDNYTNEMSVFSTLKDGEKIVATVQKMLGETVLSELKLGELSVFESKQEMHDADFYVLTPLDASSNYTRCTFVVTKGGVYKITLNKVNDKNEVVDTYYFFKSFSYSEEYLSVEQEVEEVVGEEQNTPKDMLVLLAAAGNGSFIEDLNDRATPFEGFVKDIDKTFDPRILFLILTLILMLLDIAVRKFKFKWPHELIKQWKENREKKQ